MNIPQKVINGGLIIYVGGQALIVAAGLAYHYSCQPSSAELMVDAPRYSMQEIYYGAISKPRNPVDSPQNPAFEYKIAFVAGTTGSSGDAEMVFPV